MCDSWKYVAFLADCSVLVPMNFIVCKKNEATNQPNKPQTFCFVY